MSITAAKGFQAAGMASGIKPAGVADLALVATTSREPVTAAGAFTHNLVAAAPVVISRRHLVDGQATAVVLNSGNANAATGEKGRLDAFETCTLAAGALGCRAEDVLVCSTGLIGFGFDLVPIRSGVPVLVKSLGADPANGQAAADAILTTDSVRKEAVTTVALPSGPASVVATIGGMAKGAAMLAPSMATMLAVITTDAAIEVHALEAALAAAVDSSFDQMSVDGCQSTNDTVLVLANGQAGNTEVRLGGEGFTEFADALGEVCASLAEQMTRDAEGATKFVRVRVRGARTREEARLAARAVAESQLVKCSLYGEDPYWGRVLSELGASGAHFDPERVQISYNGIVACIDGVAAASDADKLRAALREREIEIICDLHTGIREATILTTDLTHAYIDENMRTS